MEDADAILRAAEDILRCLHAHQIDAVVIGAVALAAHRYVRQTEDLDLGVNANLQKLRELADSLRQAGYHAELHEPDADDPLGGVIDIEGSFGLIQIISYADKFPAVIEDALRESRLTAGPDSALKLVPLPHQEKWHRLPADEIGLLIGKDANATVFSAHGKSIGEGTLV